MTTTKAASARRWHRAAGIALAGLLALAAGSAATAQNLVANGDFTHYVAPTANNPSTGLPYTSFLTRDQSVAVDGSQGDADVGGRISDPVDDHRPQFQGLPVDGVAAGNLLCGCQRRPGRRGIGAHFKPRHYVPRTAAGRVSRARQTTCE